jgi:hypothetical protein
LISTVFGEESEGPEETKKAIPAVGGMAFRIAIFD